MANVHFEIVTPERLVLADDAFMVVVPGSEGEFGVLIGHAPVITTLRDGELRVYSDANTVTKRIVVTGGFAEVNERGLTVLAEQATITA